MRNQTPIYGFYPYKSIIYLHKITEKNKAYYYYLYYNMYEIEIFSRVELFS